MAVVATEKVLTLDYWKRVSQLQVGDWVFDQKGNPVQVKLVQTYFADDCYEVGFNDHLTMAGDKHLGFYLENEKYRNRLWQYKGIQKAGFRRPLKHMTVDNLIETGLEGRPGRLEYSLPTAKAMQFPHQYHAIPPFIFGFWFANRKSKKRFPIYDEYADYIQQKFKDAGYQITIKPTTEREFDYFVESPNIEQQLAPNIPTKLPTNYLLCSEEERIELLSGLFCGSIKRYDVKTDTFTWVSRDATFMHDLRCLVESLGCKSSMYFWEKTGYYEFYFKTKHKIVPTQVSKPLKVHQGRRFIKEIRKIAPQMVVHIETTGDDNSIILGEGFISVC